MDDLYQSLCSVSRTEPFCDYLRFTTPSDALDSTKISLRPFIDALGCVEQSGYYRSPTGGTLTIKAHHGVVSYQHTGGFMRDLRELGHYHHYISAISLLPSYRVTKVHVAVDVSFSGADVVPWVYTRVIDGICRISRKFSLERDVKRYMGFSHARPGKETGTLYLGSPKAEIRLKVYDKAQERFDRLGVEIPDTTRFEVELSDKTGVTIRDLCFLSPLFYHMVPATFLPPPGNLPPPWVKTEAIGGYKVDRHTSRTTAFERAKHLLQGIEPTFKSISKLAHEDIERSEAFKSMIISRVERMLSLP
jgi:hypothetical protein